MKAEIYVFIACAAVCVAAGFWAGAVFNLAIAVCSVIHGSNK